MTITNASLKWQKSYEHMLKIMIKLKSVKKRKGLHLKEKDCSDKENEKINEIFDEFDDD